MSNSVTVVGQGPHKVLALHGWFGSAEGWGPMVDSLDGARFTYAFMDYRGYGGSLHLPGAYTLDEIADDALAVADRLGWDRFSLMGHSMGGAAIQHVLVKAPHRVTSLVGITPVPASGVPFPDDAKGLFTAAARDREARRTILNFSTGNRLSPVFIEQLLASSELWSTPQAFGAYFRAWSSTDIAAQVRGSKVPVQVLVGEHDAALPEAFMHETWGQWYPNARIELVGNAGHYPMFETPVALATAVERFLAQAG
jgi:pimeloyl-ACP methyl ester carboxylesterase